MSEVIGFHELVISFILGFRGCKEEEKRITVGWREGERWSARPKRIDYSPIIDQEIGERIKETIEKVPGRTGRPVFGFGVARERNDEYLMGKGWWRGIDRQRGRFGCGFGGGKSAEHVRGHWLVRNADANGPTCLLGWPKFRHSYQASQPAPHLCRESNEPGGRLHA